MGQLYEPGWRKRTQVGLEEWGWKSGMGVRKKSGQGKEQSPFGVEFKKLKVIRGVDKEEERVLEGERPLEGTRVMHKNHPRRYGGAHVKKLTRLNSNRGEVFVVVRRGGKFACPTTT